MADEIKRINYFKDISNSKLLTEWVEENGKYIEKLEGEKQLDEKFWGLFSLEGGRKENMQYIITALKYVVDDLKNNYISDNNVYSEFEKKYNEALSYRNKRQEISEKYFSLEKFECELLNKKSKFSKNVKFRESEFSNLKNNVNLFEQKSFESKSK